MHRHRDNITKRPFLAAAVTALTGACAGDYPESDDSLHVRDDLLPARVDLHPAASARFDDIGLYCGLSISPGFSSVVHMTLENRGDMDIRFLARGTAWDRANPIFTVQSATLKLPYAGVLSVRLAPGDSEFVEIAPGEAVSANYDLALEHDISEPGDYEVGLASPLITVRIDGTDMLFQHDCGVARTALATPRQGEINQLRQPLVFTAGNNCSPSELTWAQWLDYTAQIGAAAVNSVTLASTHEDPIKARWFGAISPGQDFVILQKVNFIAGFDAQNYWQSDCYIEPPQPSTFTCGGPQFTTVAWTTANSDTIYLCTPFFSGPGVTAQLGPGLAQILYHEKTHAGAGTDDVVDSFGNVVNGAAACLALAQSDPSLAISNADNYAFYMGDYYLSNLVIPTLVSLF